MSNDSTVYVGLDIHKESIIAGYAIELGEIQDLGEMGILQRDLDRLCTRMQGRAEHSFCVRSRALRVFGVSLSDRQGTSWYRVRAIEDRT